jgi:hypothetical protein
VATRILFQLVFFLLPFLAFGLYRLALAEAAQEGRKPWPIKGLFGLGLVLAVGSWLAFILIDRTDGGYCYTPSQLVDGQIIPGERYPCERDLSQIGQPRSSDPGGRPVGVGLDDPETPYDGTNRPE